MSNNEKGNITKFISILIIVIMSLFGIYVLNEIKSALWVLFMIVSYPVMAAFTSSCIGGKDFKSSDLVKIYAASIKSVPLIGRFVSKM